MSRLFSCFLFSLFLNTGAGNEFFPPHAPPAGSPAAQRPAGSPVEQGAWLAHRIDDRESGRDMRVAMRMRLYDRQNRVRERALTITGLRGGPGRPVPGDRSLIRFTQPADISGTGMLVWKQPAATDERFLYLPSLGRARRIAGSEAQDSFVGSDFTYEDISGRELDEYDYALTDDHATWRAPDGVSQAAYRLESRRKDPGAAFPRVISLVLAESFVIVHADIHNKRDEVQKTYDVRRLERVPNATKTASYWTALEMVMSDVLQRTRTELVVERAEYDVGLKPDDFSRLQLERGSRVP